MGNVARARGYLDEGGECSLLWTRDQRLGVGRSWWCVQRGWLSPLGGCVRAYSYTKESWHCRFRRSSFHSSAHRANTLLWDTVFWISYQVDWCAVIAFVIKLISDHDIYYIRYDYCTVVLYRYVDTCSRDLSYWVTWRTCHTASRVEGISNPAQPNMHFSRAYHSQPTDHCGG